MSNIKEAEEQTGISRANIRYYEKMGLLQPKRNEKNGYREYRPEDIKRILQIKILRKLDVPIEEIKDTFDRPEMLGKVIQKQKERLEKRRAELTDAIDFCKEIKEENLGEFDPQYYLKKMDEKEKKGAVFADLLNDFKKVSKAEAEARFSFRPELQALRLRSDGFQIPDSRRLFSLSEIRGHQARSVPHRSPQSRVFPGLPFSVPPSAFHMPQDSSCPAYRPAAPAYPVYPDRTVRYLRPYLKRSHVLPSLSFSH